MEEQERLKKAMNDEQQAEYKELNIREIEKPTTTEGQTPWRLEKTLESTLPDGTVVTTTFIVEASKCDNQDNMEQIVSRSVKHYFPRFYLDLARKFSRR